MSDLKLHLGSGTHYAPGWVNVDMDGHHQVDLLAPAQDLPDFFPENTFSHVYLGHFLEHVPWNDIPYILGRVLQTCTKDVRIAVVGPCMTKALATGQPQWLLEAIEAHGDGPGGHAWTATTEKTLEALQMSGLTAHEVPIQEVSKPDWPNPNSFSEWQCAFFAYRAG